MPPALPYAQLIPGMYLTRACHLLGAGNKACSAGSSTARVAPNLRAACRAAAVCCCCWEDTFAGSELNCIAPGTRLCVNSDISGCAIDVATVCVAVAELAVALLGLSVIALGRVRLLLGLSAKFSDRCSLAGMARSPIAGSMLR